VGEVGEAPEPHASWKTDAHGFIRLRSSGRSLRVPICFTERFEQTVLVGWLVALTDTPGDNNETGSKSRLNLNAVLTDALTVRCALFYV
jgi:hypothetical protein